MCNGNKSSIIATAAVDRRRRLLVLCPYPQNVAAGQRLKYEQYFDDWRSAGLDVDVSSFMDMRTWEKVYSAGNYGRKVLGVVRGHTRRLHDLLRIRRYDFVYIFMWVTPFGTSVMERLIRLMARRLIFDVEDNVLTDQGLANEYNPNWITKFFKGPHKARYLIRTADHVITSSPFLNEVCLNINLAKACTYISSSVDTDRFVPRKTQSTEGPVTIGWTGTFSSKVYLDQLRDVFLRLSLRTPFRLKIIGNFAYDLPGVELEVIRWTREREVEDLQTFDIGVYPLPINDWVLGKSGLKAIQYMAFGLPTVATEVGTTPLIMRNGVEGILVKTDDEWLEALEMLVREPDLRRKMGEAGRRNAVARFSTHVIAGHYRRILDEVAESRS